MNDALESGPNPTPAQAQCSVCKQTFGGITLFDRHRRNGHCIDPRTLTGVHRNDRGVWKMDDKRPHPPSARPSGPQNDEQAQP